MRILEKGILSLLVEIGRWGGMSMIVDNCAICGKEINDTDLAFITSDGKKTVCSEDCNFSYDEKLAEY